MSSSLAGAIKTVIEAGGLSLTAYRDDVGKGTPASRYVTISEGISTTTENLGDSGATDALTELVQVDLWQPWRAHSGGDPAEDYTLADRLYAVLHGARLATAPMTVRSCTVDSYPRLVEREENTVHHAFTLRIRRER